MRKVEEVHFYILKMIRDKSSDTECDDDEGGEGGEGVPVCPSVRGQYGVRAGVRVRVCETGQPWQWDWAGPLTVTASLSPSSLLSLTSETVSAGLS